MSEVLTSTKLESVEKIAKNLVAVCRKGDFSEAVRKYYADDVVSIESMAMEGQSREVRGIEAVMKKKQMWNENTEVHKMDVSEPLVAGSYFTVRYILDATCKQTNQRMTMEEIGVYKVENGKIVREEFLYDCGDCG